MGRGPCVFAGLVPTTPRRRSAELGAGFALYWSLRDGTGDVERSLGMFAAMQHSHTGGREGEICFAEACLEVAEEGPTSENEVAAQAEREGGVL